MKNSLKWAVCAGICAFSANAANAQTFAISSAGDYGGSHSSFPASKAIDGNTAWSSRWAANNGGSASNLYIDLGSVQKIDDIGVAWGRGDERTHTFEVRARAGTSGSWTKIYSGTSSGTTTDIEQYNVTDMDARQVRIKVFSNSAGTNWTNVTEFEAYGTAGPDGGTDPGTTDPGRVSVPAKIEAEDYTNYYDNNSTNSGGAYRTSEGVDVKVTQDTGGGYNVGWFYTGEWLEYDISVSSAGNYEADVRLSTTQNNKTFTLSVDGSSESGAQSITNTGNWNSFYTKTGVDLGYLSAGNHTIRLAASNGPFDVNWIDIKSGNGDNGNGNGELDPTKAPSGNFDLSQWKLTLPTSKNAYFGSGGTAAAEIQPDSCSNSAYSGVGLDEGYQDYDYFYTGTDGSMVFETPLTGGASTITSSYVRSELRELYEWSPCDDDGAANWSPSGTHVLSGTVSVVDYYSSDPQTIVGQIHAKDSSKALLKLQWDGPTKDVRAIINEDPVSGNPFSIDFGLIPGTDEWSYVITLKDGKMTISVTYNGTTVTESVTFGSGDMSDDWFDHVYYFKAGNYAQADKDSGGNFEVRFTALEATHSN